MPALFERDGHFFVAAVRAAFDDDAFAEFGVPHALTGPELELARLSVWMPAASAPSAWPAL